MHLHKVSEFWGSSLREIGVRSGDSVIRIHIPQRRIQMRILFPERELCVCAREILGSRFSSSEFTKIIDADFPLNEAETARLLGSGALENVIALRLNLNVDNTIVEYNIVDFFKTLTRDQHQTLTSLYFRVTYDSPSPPC